jgi:hypothetical protein
MAANSGSSAAGADPHGTHTRRDLSGPADPEGRPDTAESGRRPGVSRAEVVGLVAAAAVVAAYLLAPLMGGDLSAQLARADFASAHPLTPVDLQWFGGFLPLGYSAWVPWIMSLVGVRTTGAIATVIAGWLTGRLLARTHAIRPAWGAAAAAITLGSNLVEGRVTFACGVACGLGALLALTRRGRWAFVVAALLAFVAGAASPVAALLLAVCAVALLGVRRAGSAGALLVSVVPAAVLSLTFADPGRALLSANDAARAIAVSALVAVVVPRRAIQIAAVTGAALVLAVYLVATPVGVSATRLSLLFAVPVVVAYAAVRRLWLPLVVALAVVAQPPITFGTLANAGSKATTAAYYQPLLDRLASVPMTGRVEIPELTGHWEAYYVARHIPISRGWLRQTDTGENDDTFYSHVPNVQSYQAFLRRTATQYVAVADASATYYGRREIALIDSGVPYLREVWRSAHWRLYEVDGATPLVAAPGALVGQNAAQLVVEAPADSVVIMRIRWWRWLTVRAGPADACIARTADGVALRVGKVGGRYVISSDLHTSAGRHQC